MSEYINEDYYEFDNDASASSFGWNFQANAGIFLFLKYIKQASDLTIESKMQDIEITLLNGTKVLAQAKSAQDYTVAKDKKEKFKDAIISLARNPQKGTKLIYISNIPDTFKSAIGSFNNKIVPYSSCLQKTKNEIDSTILSISTAIDKKIVKENKIVNKKKLKQMKDKIDKLDKEVLYFSTLNPYFGIDDNRYIVISDTILEFLINTIKLNRNDAICVRQRLLEHWQLTFEHNSTVSDKFDKRITKKDFAWPIAAFLIDDDIYDVADCLTFTPDQSIINEVKHNMECPESVYHERFQFSNLVLQEFESYKKEIYGTGLRHVEKEFIKQKYKMFLKEFSFIPDCDVQEYISKAFLYRIVCNNRNMQKISIAVGLKI